MESDFSDAFNDGVTPPVFLCELSEFWEARNEFWRIERTLVGSIGSSVGLDSI